MSHKKVSSWFDTGRGKDIMVDITDKMWSIYLPFSIMGVVKWKLETQFNQIYAPDKCTGTRVDKG